MKVVFDAYWWVEGTPSLRHVLREIVFAWATRFPQDSIALVVRKRHLAAAERDAPAGAQLVATSVRPQALLAAYVTERVRRRLGFDAVVVHNFSARSAKLSATYLHDVLFLTNPEWFTRIELAYYSLMVRWIRRADVVFASSASESERIRSRTSARRVVPVGLGLSTELVFDSSQRPVEGLVAGSYLLTVGRLNVRKNLERTLLGALSSGRIDADFPLVVVGGANGKAAQDADPRIDAAVADGSIRFCGHIDEPELRWIYAHASAFVFLSLGEGFGMPPIEAQYFGTRVLASDLPVFRENLGAGALFVDPTDVEAIAAGIRRVLEPADPDDPDGGALIPPEAVAAQHNWQDSVERMRAELVRSGAEHGAGEPA